MDKTMSIIYCEKHDRQWDSDRLEDCPVCDSAPRDIGELKHSKTPWLLVNKHGKSRIYSRPFRPGKHVAQVFSECTITKDIADIERESNAAFIVRACNSHDDLVAALKSAISALDASAMSGYSSSGATEQMRSALVKARCE